MCANDDVVSKIAMLGTFAMCFDTSHTEIQESDRNHQFEFLPGPQSHNQARLEEEVLGELAAEEEFAASFETPVL